MKLEQLIVQYLYNNKKVTIQDIGSFSVSPDFVVPSDNDKETVLSEGAISFEFDPKAMQDEGLIEFITQQTRKIKPLATSDLESYSILSKQFLNLGKPLAIDGLGTLQKSQQGIYLFTQGHTVNARLEAAPAKIKDKDREEISFRSPEKKSRNNSKKAALIIAALLFVLLAGAAIFYVLYQNNHKNENADVATMDTVATMPVTLPAADSLKKAVADSTKPITPVPDGSTFKVVIKEYNTKEAAQKAYDRLTRYGHKLVMAPIDSMRYKLVMPFTIALADTTRVKDSLSKFFQTKAYLDPR